MIQLTPPLLAFLGLGGMELGIMIGIVGIVFGGIMGLAGMYFKHQRDKLWHETARIALEKGQPVPPADPDDHPGPHAGGDNLRQHDLRGGLVLIAVGAGLFLFLRLVTGNGIAAVGAIPGFIGVALLVHYVLMRPRDRKSDTATPRS